jgi:hypothetical protein
MTERTESSLTACARTLEAVRGHTGRRREACGDVRRLPLFSMD